MSYLCQVPSVTNVTRQVIHWILYWRVICVSGTIGDECDKADDTLNVLLTCHMYVRYHWWRMWHDTWYIECFTDVSYVCQVPSVTNVTRHMIHWMFYWRVICMSGTIGDECDTTDDTLNVLLTCPMYVRYHRWRMWHDRWYIECFTDVSYVCQVPSVTNVTRQMIHWMFYWRVICMSGTIGDECDTTDDTLNVLLTCHMYVRYHRWRMWHDRWYIECFTDVSYVCQVPSVTNVTRQMIHWMFYWRVICMSGTIGDECDTTDDTLNVLLTCHMYVRYHRWRMWHDRWYIECFTDVSYVCQVPSVTNATRQMIHWMFYWRVICMSGTIGDECDTTDDTLNVLLTCHMYVRYHRWRMWHDRWYIECFTDVSYVCQVPSVTNATRQMIHWMFYWRVICMSGTIGDECDTTDDTLNVLLTCPMYVRYHRWRMWHDRWYIECFTDVSYVCQVPSVTNVTRQMIHWMFYWRVLCMSGTIGDECDTTDDTLNVLLTCPMYVRYHRWRMWHDRWYIECFTDVSYVCHGTMVTMDTTDDTLNALLTCHVRYHGDNDTTDDTLNVLLTCHVYSGTMVTNTRQMIHWMFYCRVLCMSGTMVTMDTTDDTLNVLLTCHYVCQVPWWQCDTTDDTLNVLLTCPIMSGTIGDECDTTDNTLNVLLTCPMYVRYHQWRMDTTDDTLNVLLTCPMYVVPRWRMWHDRWYIECFTDVSYVCHGTIGTNATRQMIHWMLYWRVLCMWYHGDECDTTDDTLNALLSCPMYVRYHQWRMWHVWYIECFTDVSYVCQVPSVTNATRQWYIECFTDVSYVCQVRDECDTTDDTLNALLTCPMYVRYHRWRMWHDRWYIECFTDVSCVCQVPSVTNVTRQIIHWMLYWRVLCMSGTISDECDTTDNTLNVLLTCHMYVRYHRWRMRHDRWYIECFTDVSHVCQVPSVTNVTRQMIHWMFYWRVLCMSGTIGTNVTRQMIHWMFYWRVLCMSPVPRWRMWHDRWYIECFTVVSYVCQVPSVTNVTRQWYIECITVVSYVCQVPSVTNGHDRWYIECFTDVSYVCQVPSVTNVTRQMIHWMFYWCVLCMSGTMTNVTRHWMYYCRVLHVGTISDECDTTDDTLNVLLTCPMYVRYHGDECDTTDDTLNVLLTCPMYVRYHRWRIHDRWYIECFTDVSYVCPGTTTGVLLNVVPRHEMIHWMFYCCHMYVTMVTNVTRQMIHWMYYCRVICMSGTIGDEWTRQMIHWMFYCVSYVCQVPSVTNVTRQMIHWMFYWRVICMSGTIGDECDTTDDTLNVLLTCPMYVRYHRWRMWHDRWYIECFTDVSYVCQVPSVTNVTRHMIHWMFYWRVLCMSGTIGDECDTTDDTLNVLLTCHMYVRYHRWRMWHDRWYIECFTDVSYECQVPSVTNVTRHMIHWMFYWRVICMSGAIGDECDTWWDQCSTSVPEAGLVWVSWLRSRYVVHRLSYPTHNSWSSSYASFPSYMGSMYVTSCLHIARFCVC